MKLNSFLFTTLLLLISLTLFSACGSDHDDDHDSYPIGLVLSVDGTDIAFQEETSVIYIEGNSIEIPENGQLVVDLQFISEDGHRFYPDVNDGYSLVTNVTYNQILNISHPINNHEWTFAMVGLTAGSIYISFELWHGGHSDFESRPFQVSVIEVGPQ